MCCVPARGGNGSSVSSSKPILLCQGMLSAFLHPVLKHKPLKKWDKCKYNLTKIKRQMFNSISELLTPRIHSLRWSKWFRWRGRKELKHQISREWQPSLGWRWQMLKVLERSVKFILHHRNFKRRPINSTGQTLQAVMQTLQSFEEVLQY